MGGGFADSDAIHILIMGDWPFAAVRFGLYGGLGLLFGVPLFVLTTPSGEVLWRMFRLERVLVVLAAGGMALSLLGFLMLAARMSGAPLGELDPALVKTLLADTALGWSQVARLAALSIIFAVVWLMPARQAQRILLTIFGAIAVGSLAWGGHAAGGEGAAGLFHLGFDIVHLLAASTWLGAIALLLALVGPGAQETRERGKIAHLALAGFGRTGTVAVALIALTGVANAGFTVDSTTFPALAASAYGRLLLVKLALFCAMLGCAVLNRYRLTPTLQASISRGELRPSLTRLRRSIAVEAGLALAVLALVSWLGLMAPDGTV